MKYRRRRITPHSCCPVDGEHKCWRAISGCLENTSTQRWLSRSSTCKSCGRNRRRDFPYAVQTSVIQTHNAPTSRFPLCSANVGYSNTQCSLTLLANEILLTCSFAARCCSRNPRRHCPAHSLAPDPFQQAPTKRMGAPTRLQKSCALLSHCQS